MSPEGDRIALKELLKLNEAQLVDQVVAFNATKVRRIGEIKSTGV